jgi:hypothetical protein
MTQSLGANFVLVPAKIEKTFVRVNPIGETGRPN